MDDRDNLRSKREEMVLATWGPDSLTSAVLDLIAALVADGATPVATLVVCDLVTWGLQADPAARPQSCEEMLAHPFFTADIGSLEAAPPTGLRMPGLLTAAALGDLPTVEAMVAQGGALAVPWAYLFVTRETTNKAGVVRDI